ncbi:putative DNA modification/repair radical SAM protein [Sphingobacterium sp. DK4209]|uniref:Putative DNA modification/repair radical SAM protein n=1 Tax=Sphingobacterium zhuxiongii TaxID=2662364 RepID=A0A5Q0QCF1_9SPHI|nr:MULTISPECIES: putative DNA modification/repair radical SAM protein [unclassified Sphingobacterium]MVZ64635.1 putative DNA modification/repair radical SAM protein [Sphingobacterium sp. DK4209]QGA26974.1 putative DNA modification/repair radical SAM protein [Sphingobacterium sp. dk4302]
MITAEEKLAILADAAKYDVSCSSSGGKRKNEGGIGDSSRSGICHTYTEDGRCVSLLKILLTNYCIYDCAFCVSRRSNDIQRAAFSVNEVVELTMNFYRRNYIEGLFLSSGIFKSADFTMERLMRIVKKLRTEERFFGYIHLKTIPGASEELIKEAGLYVDRMSINLEIPTEEGLKQLAPEKDHDSVRKPLQFVDSQKIMLAEEKKLIKHVPSFVPAGQSTQMVVGATSETDYDIMKISKEFYDSYNLKRVYYSGYIPINNSHNSLPQIGSAPPLLRENRLYQTDWLLRFYKFDLNELLNPEHQHLDLDVDPKLSWALRNPHFFPIDINSASYSMILRVPGIGRGSALKIVQARKFGKLHEHQLKKIGIAFNRAKFFIRYADSIRNWGDLQMDAVRRTILNNGSSKYQAILPSAQLSLFA